MKKFFAAAILAFSMVGCSKVPAGNVGVKVYLLGGAKGVDSEVLGTGRYWIGINEELYLFPTFQQNYTWTKEVVEGDPADESITFQTSEGMEVNADLGISYTLDPLKISNIFQKYRKGVDEITDIYLRNYVRDSLNSHASKLPIESVYGSGKTDLIQKVEEDVRHQVSPEGIIVDRIYLVGSLRLPATVVTALNAKIEATQKAQQRENEVAQATAEANKVVAAATGEANAKKLLAEAEANANRTVAASVTDELIRYEQVKKWNGALPTTQLGANSGTLFTVK